jgi:hypothetical protein
MLELGGRADQPSAKQEVDARLQMRQIRDRHEQFAGRRQHAMHLGQRPRLIIVGQMLQHVEAERAIERRVRKRQRHQRCRRHRADV